MTPDLDVLAEDLRAALGGVYVRAVWTVGAEPVRDPAALLAGLGAADGWLMLPDAVFVLRDGAWTCVAGHDPGRSPAVAELADRVLEAEFVTGPTESLHLRRVRGQLRAFRLREGAGEAVLVEERRQVSTESARGLGRLRYRVAWRPVPEGDPAVDVLRPWVARFCGWEE